MTPQDPTPSNATGAGAPIVLSLMAGLVIGFLLRQPTIGFLVGTSVGIAIAVLIWMRDRGAGR